MLKDTFQLKQNIISNPKSPPRRSTNGDRFTKFNWREYLIANVDLIDGGIDTEDLATKHWRDIGKFQNRDLVSKTFDWTQYIAINQDLIYQGNIRK